MKFWNFLLLDGAILKEVEASTEEMQPASMKEMRRSIHYLRHNAKKSFPLQQACRMDVCLGFPHLDQLKTASPKIADKMGEMSGVFCFMEPGQPVPLMLCLMLPSYRTVDEDLSHLHTFVKLSIMTNSPPQEQQIATAEHILSHRPCIIGIPMEQPKNDNLTPFVAAMPSLFGAALLEDDERLNNIVNK